MIQTTLQAAGLAQRYLVRVAVEDEQVEHEHADDDGAEHDPQDEIG